MKKFTARISTLLITLIMIISLVPFSVFADEWNDDGWDDAGADDGGWVEDGWEGDDGWDDAGWDDTGWEDDGWDDTGWEDDGWDDTGWEDDGWDEETTTEAYYDPMPVEVWTEPVTEAPIEVTKLVARINEKTYTSLQDAFNDAKDKDIIILLDNFTIYSKVTFEKDCEVTLDLMSYTIQLEKRDNEEGAFIEMKKGTLTITDSSVNETGAIRSNNREKRVFEISNNDQSMVIIPTVLNLQLGAFEEAEYQQLIAIKDSNDFETSLALVNNDVERVKVEITGGTYYDILPAEYLPMGYQENDNYNGTWKVELATNSDQYIYPEPSDYQEPYTEPAQYNEPTYGYTITWLNWDGTVLQTSVLSEGEYPFYQGEEPYRAEDNSYFYIFAGWDNAFVPAAGDATYTALFDLIPKATTYSISWYNYDYTLLYTIDVNEGEIPIYPGEEPTRAQDDDYFYVFAGWDPAVVPATEGKIYTALFDAIPLTKSYSISWYNSDNTLLATIDVKEGEIPVYPGDEPYMEADENYTYTFAGWEPEVVAVTEGAIYTAVYDMQPIVHEYTVEWYDYNGELLETSTVTEGEVPVFSADAPYRDADENNMYEFSGWTPEVTAATGNTAYTAQYTEIPISKIYIINWYDEDGTVLQIGEVLEGEVPVYYGVEPSKEADAEYIYQFAGWTPEVTGAAGDAEYTAVYSTVKQQYIVAFETNGHGEFIGGQLVEYGDKIEMPEDPTDDGYEFIGWSKDADSVLDFWDFDNDLVDKDTILYAVWGEKEENSGKVDVDFPENPEETTEVPKDEPTKPEESTEEIVTSPESKEVETTVVDKETTTAFSPEKQEPTTKEQPSTKETTSPSQQPTTSPVPGQQQPTTKAQPDTKPQQPTTQAQPATKAVQPPTTSPAPGQQQPTTKVVQQPTTSPVPGQQQPTTKVVQNVPDKETTINKDQKEKDDEETQPQTTTRPIDDQGQSSGIILIIILAAIAAAAICAIVLVAIKLGKKNR